ncbi:MAG: LacI family DNA-binding transcriptional regulator [bacterium]
MAKATIYDVSGAARVSLATVSRVLNNPEKVNKETRDRVLAVIKELGYKPNAIARGLASRKTTTVAIMVSDITRASVSQTIGGIMDIANQYNYSIKIYPMDGLPSNEVARTVAAEQVDGVLILNDELSNEEMTEVYECLEDSNIPVVLSNVVYENDYPSVYIDYVQASYDITKELIEKNRKNIYLVSTLTNYTTNTQKEIGYTKAMQEASLEPKILRTSGDLDVCTKHFETFFNENPVDAAIAVRDSIGVAFINAARNIGKKIPEDVMVAGFQNTKYAKLSRPTMTCVDNPVYAIGAVAMRLLTKYMGNEEVEDNKVVMPHKVIYRESMK